MEERYLIKIKGIVQSVGFRPTVYRYAKENQLFGFVLNSSEGVVIEVEGKKEKIKRFIEKIKKFPPERAKIEEIYIEKIGLKYEKEFRIIESEKKEKVYIDISPDISTCNDCLNELFDITNRRYLFPFINCTNCGPRFTIIKNIPYDRKNTTMDEFKMCEKCKEEYLNPENRRYHAEPTCCFNCGPEIKLIDSKGKFIEKGIEAIKVSARLIKEGKILLIKGIGGYHLSCNAENENAIEILRERKKRYEKPFALMARNIKVIKKYCKVSKKEEEILKGFEAPIVLLKKKNEILPKNIAPYNKYLGFFLPYTPIHHLLFYFEKELNVLIMTSGNLSEEPIVYDEGEAFENLAGIFDFILTHNRKIYINCDDSVLKVFNRNIYFIRRSRGYAPSGIEFPYKFEKSFFASGSDLKNTFAFAREKKVYLSQHIGDLENYASIKAYKKSVELFKRIIEIEPEVAVYDMHPEYFSSKITYELFPNIKKIGVYHHHSHIASVMADNFLKNEKVIGVSFDGTGYGADGNIWGGEFLICDYKEFERFAHLKYLPIPGGEKAIKEIWRIGASYLYKTFGDDFLNLEIEFIKKIDFKKLAIIKEMIDENLNSPLNSSMGRFFDAVSAITGIREKISYEGQGAIELEMKIKIGKSSPYNYEIKKNGKVYVIDHTKIIKEIVDDIKKGFSIGIISYRFHITICDIIRNVCNILRKERNLNKVALSGGVFQNNFLLKKVFEILKKDGFFLLIHRKVPPNDGGISLGQISIAYYKDLLEKEEKCVWQYR